MKYYKKAAYMLSLSMLIMSNTVAFAEDVSVIKQSNSDSNAKILKISTKTTDSVNSEKQLSEEITSIEDKIQSLKDENKQLEKELSEINQGIESLSKNIVSRKEIIARQLRNLQTNPQDIDLISTILDSKSLDEAINKVVNLKKLTDAQQDNLNKEIKEKNELEQKQKRTQEAIKLVLKNQEIIQSEEWDLNVKKAQLDVSTLENLIKQETDETKKSEYQQKLEDAKLKVESAKEEQRLKEERLLAEKRKLAEQSQQSTENIYVGNVSTNQVQTIQQSNTQYSASGAYDYAGAYSYPVGQCTWGAKVLAPWAGSYWGNGGQWSASAAAAGFKVGYTPIPGSLICFTDGGYGHIAFVTDVRSDGMIQILESNYGGNMSIGNYRGWFNPLTSGGGSISYIYPPGS